VELRAAASTGEQQQQRGDGRPVSCRLCSLAQRQCIAEQPHAKASQFEFKRQPPAAERWSATALHSPAAAVASARALPVACPGPEEETAQCGAWMRAEATLIFIAQLVVTLKMQTGARRPPLTLVSAQGGAGLRHTDATAALPHCATAVPAARLR